MVATTTRSINSLRKKIIASYPQFTFLAAENARWSPHDHTVYYSDQNNPHEIVVLLHELSHGLLNHQTYHQDVELLSIEQAAWQKAELLAATFQIEFDHDIIDDHMDTYREWLHARSRCPKCAQAGIQQIDLTYRCVLCDQSWQVNDARQCGLKRYPVVSKTK